jgi:hypothetical protein
MIILQTAGTTVSKITSQFIKLQFYEPFESLKKLVEPH